MAYFYPELTLGKAGLSARRRSEIGDFLVNVVHQRGHPLHLANLWNALYFRWDLKSHRYVASTIDESRIPRRRLYQQGSPLPVGAFLRVETETRAGDLWAEVVYKEGARQEVTDYDLDPQLSGDPGKVIELNDSPAVVLRERFVLDFDAFGAEQNRVTKKGWERLLSKAVWVDELGHLQVDAVYTPGQAQLEDVDQYINYLLQNHREGLLAFCFSEEPGKDELREALLKSFGAVRDIALERAELGSWRQRIFFSKERYRQQVSAGDVPLGEGDLSHLFASISRIEEGRQARYVAIGPRLDEILSRAALKDRELLRGAGYARGVAYANTYIMERIQDGAKDGVLEGGAHLRLDDDWQAGGIWRCEKVSERSSIALLPADLPLGLGYAQTRSPETTHNDAGTDPEAVTVRSCTVALTPTDIAMGRLRLTEQVRKEIQGRDQITVRLGHDGQATEYSGTIDEHAGEICEIPWPPSFYAGIKMKVNVERRGAVLNVRSETLPEPITIDGVELRFDFRESVYRQAYGGPKLTGGDHDGASTLKDLISRVFRRYGRDIDQGRKALSMPELVDIIFGPRARSTEKEVLSNTLAGMAVELEGDHYIWTPRLSPRTSTNERALLEAFDETQPDRRLTKIVKQHWVPMFLRQMVERGVSGEKIRTYAKARIEYGMQGILPAELPTGYTWVVGHSRGGFRDQPAEADPQYVATTSELRNQP